MVGFGHDVRTSHCAPIAAGSVPGQASGLPSPSGKGRQRSEGEPLCPSHVSPARRGKPGPFCAPLTLTLFIKCEGNAPLHRPYRSPRSRG